MNLIRKQLTVQYLKRLGMREIDEILRIAKEKGERSFELEKYQIERDLRLTPIGREAYILELIKTKKRIIKGLEGYVEDMPQHLRPYDPENPNSIASAKLDLQDGCASRDDLIRVFQMKYFEYKAIEYLSGWTENEVFYSYLVDEDEEIGRRCLLAIRSRIAEKLREKPKTAGASEIIKACLALNHNDIIRDFCDEEDNITISGFYSSLDKFFERSISHQSYHKAIRTNRGPKILEKISEYDSLITDIKGSDN